MRIPKEEKQLKGSGDLFAALLLTFMDKDGDLKSSLEKACSVVQRVIRRTVAYAVAQTDSTDKQTQTIDTIKENEECLELRVVQSKFDVEHPRIEILAEEVSLFCKIIMKGKSTLFSIFGH